MKYLKQFGMILLITFVGEILRFLLPLPIPASIYGLILMFVLLCTKVLRLEDIREAAEFLIAIMPVMFIPAAAGLIDSWSQVQPIVVQMLITMIAVTFIVMAVTGKTAMFIIGKDRRNRS